MLHNTCMIQVQSNQATQLNQLAFRTFPIYLLQLNLFVLNRERYNNYNNKFYYMNEGKKKE